MPHEKQSETLNNSVLCITPRFWSLYDDDFIDGLFNNELLTYL